AALVRRLAGRAEGLREKPAERTRGLSPGARPGSEGAPHATLRTTGEEGEGQREQEEHRADDDDRDEEHRTSWARRTGARVPSGGVRYPSRRRPHAGRAATGSRRRAINRP